MKPLLFPLFLFFPFLLCAQTVDSAAIRQVDSLIQISRTLTGQGDFQQALEINAEAEKIALEKLGWESAVYGSCCFNHGRVMYTNRNYPEAEKWFLKSIEIREKALGKQHLDYAQSLASLAFAYRYMGNYEKAIPLMLEATSIRENVQGKDTPLYARSLNSLATLYCEIDNYEKAEQLWIESTTIYEKVFGKEHLDYAQSLANLALVNSNIGSFEKAEKFMLEAKSIREKVLGKEHPVYAESVHNLALLYYRMGNFEKAAPLYLEARAIWGKTRGKEHPDYFMVSYNLASLYAEMGNFKEAEQLFIESKAIREKVLGNEHPEYAQSLNGLAILYVNIGQYEKAEQLFLEAKTIWGKNPGKESSRYATILNNLSAVYTKIGRFNEAESLNLESTAICEKIFGKEHPDYAINLHNLAGVYYKMGNYQKAESVYLESIAIEEKTLGKEHPDYARTLSELALLYYVMGNYEKAEPLMLESKSIQERILGKEHPDYAKTLNNLAALYLGMSQYDRAELFFLELTMVNQALIETSVQHLSESEITKYLNTFIRGQNQILTFAQMDRSKNIASACYDNTLFYKGFLLQAAGRIKQLALRDEGATEKFNRLKGYQRRLAAQYAQPIAERDSAQIAQLENQANDLEKDLTRTVAGYGEAIHQVKWQEVQAALQPEAAAVEFVSYRYYGKKETDSMMYAALVILPGTDQPQFIPLFEEKQLDSLLQTQGERKADYVNALYTMPERGLQPIGPSRKSLYELIWQPLEKELASVKTIYFSPSGLLHRLNFNAIPISAEETLADHYNLVRLNSTRQLVIPAKVEIAAQDAILYGGAQYDMDSTAIATANKDYHSDLMATRGELSFSYADSTNRSGAWSYLKWTDKEVDQIQITLTAAGFQTHMRKNYAASEESFKTIGREGPSPRILHLATHGFFFPDAARRSFSEGSPQAFNDQPVFKISDHPMIRSGLILAGGNYAWLTGKPIRPDMEDGIITAYEISQMNLSNTELVVLSACETGLGDIKGNEGVYGLQRAFKIAGAKYLIMSLWHVPDRQTMEFMNAFYKHWLEEEMSIPAAFKVTQLEMRDRFFDPYAWAGFVLVE